MLNHLDKEKIEQLMNDIWSLKYSFATSADVVIKQFLERENKILGGDTKFKESTLWNKLKSWGFHCVGKIISTTDKRKYDVGDYKEAYNLVYLIVYEDTAKDSTQYKTFYVGQTSDSLGERLYDLCRKEPSEEEKNSSDVVSRKIRYEALTKLCHDSNPPVYVFTLSSIIINILQENIDTLQKTGTQVQINHVTLEIPLAKEFDAQYNHNGYKGDSIAMLEHEAKQEKARKELESIQKPDDYYHQYVRRLLKVAHDDFDDDVDEIETLEYYINEYHPSSEDWDKFLCHQEGDDEDYDYSPSHPDETLEEFQDHEDQDWPERS